MVRISTSVDADGMSPEADFPIPRLPPKRCKAPLMALATLPPGNGILAMRLRQSALRPTTPLVSCAHWASVPGSVGSLTCAPIYESSSCLSPHGCMKHMHTIDPRTAACTAASYTPDDIQLRDPHRCLLELGTRSWGGRKRREPQTRLTFVLASCTTRVDAPSTGAALLEMGSVVGQSW
jgi:hypothetical protein